MSDQPGSPRALGAEEGSVRRISVSVSDLRLGMFVSASGMGWTDQRFFAGGMLLRSQADLDEVRAGGRRVVWIDQNRAAPAPAAPAAPDLPTIAEPASEGSHTPARRAGPAARRPTLAAARLFRSAVPKMAALFAEARMGQSIDLPLCCTLVDQIGDLAQHHPHALFAIARLKQHDEYTFMHSLSVCALMMALGTRIGFSDAKIRSVGLGGLLHDIGKALVPLDVINKPAKLTTDEFDLMKDHTELGHELLRNTAVTDPIALVVCLGHHEKLDGSGYPAGRSHSHIRAVSKANCNTQARESIGWT